MLIWKLMVTGTVKKTSLHWDFPGSYLAKFLDGDFEVKFSTEDEDETSLGATKTLWKNAPYLKKVAWNRKAFYCEKFEYWYRIKCQNICKEENQKMGVLFENNFEKKTHQMITKLDHKIYLKET